MIPAPSQSHRGLQRLDRFLVLGVEPVGHTEYVVRVPGRWVEFQSGAELRDRLGKPAQPGENLAQLGVGKLRQRIELYATPQLGQRFLEPSHRGEEEAVHGTGLCEAGIELERAEKVLLGLRPLELVRPAQPSQRQVCFGQSLVQLECPGRRLPDLR